MRSRVRTRVSENESEDEGKREREGERERERESEKEREREVYYVVGLVYHARNGTNDTYVYTYMHTLSYSHTQLYPFTA